MKEITLRAIFLSILITAALAGANAYLGLKAGMTVSASIPAAVISMGVLACLAGRKKGNNIFENNMVQTAASAGESLAAGVIFTIPALILLGHWTDFSFWEVSLIAGLGGILGILFCIPLRRAFIVDSKELTFPEGLATAEVLKEGEKGGAGASLIGQSALLGGLFKFLQSGFRMWGEALEGAKFLGGKWLAYIGTNLSPALLGVGYIVGKNIGILVFLGGCIAWIVGLPLYIYLNGSELINGESINSIVENSPVDGAYLIWSKKIRYLGVGAMAVGGVYALLKVWNPVLDGIRSGMEAYRKMGIGQKDLPREERNIPMPFVLGGICLLLIPIILYYNHVISDMNIALVMGIIMVLAGFLFSSVAGYMGGLVGSSNNPISGITIATLLFTSFVLLYIGKGSIGPAAAIFVGSIVCCAASIGSDILQDLKCGNIINATPWKQEVMEILGVVVAALVITPVLSLLHNAYGIGSDAHLPIEAQGNFLAAPQAGLMASVAEGILGGPNSTLPWNLVYIGILIGVLIILWDKRLEKAGSSFRAPVLAVAVGIYLPIELAVPIFLGGYLRHYLHYGKKHDTSRQGVLVCSGLITGEALMGILLAGVIVSSVSIPVISLGSAGPWLGFACLILIARYLSKKVM